MQEAHRGVDAKLNTRRECMENPNKAQNNRYAPILRQPDDVGWLHSDTLGLLRQLDEEREATDTACDYVQAMGRCRDEIAIERIVMKGLNASMKRSYLGDYDLSPMMIPFTDALCDPRYETRSPYASEATLRDDRDIITSQGDKGNQLPIGAERLVDRMAGATLGCSAARLAGQRSGTQTMSRRYGHMSESITLDSAYVAERYRAESGVDGVEPTQRSTHLWETFDCQSAVEPVILPSCL